MPENTAVFHADQEHTLVLIKPDGYQRGLVGEVISRIERRGFKLVAIKIAQPTEAELTEHYYEHKDQFFFKGMLEYMMSGPIVALVAEGNQVIKSFRAMMGATNPVLAEAGTIRGDLGRDWGEGPIVNIVHGSDNPDSADREIAVWFPELIEE